jgi:hypothetical protein
MICSAIVDLRPYWSKALPCFMIDILTLIVYFLTRLKFYIDCSFSCPLARLISILIYPLKTYCAVQPFDPENRATSLWDYKKVCVAGTFNDPSDAFKYMYQYHLQATKVVDHRLHINNNCRWADETEAEDQEQCVPHTLWALDNWKMGFSSA